MPIAMAPSQQKKQHLPEICRGCHNYKKTFRGLLWGFLFVVCGGSLRKARLSPGKGHAEPHKMPGQTAGLVFPVAEGFGKK